MYAVVVAGGKQYRVQPGEILRMERLPSKEGDTVEFDKVLLIGDGDKVVVGQPYIEGGKVAATIKAHGKGKKISVIKFKRRKQYRRKQGHRQHYTEVEVTGIVPGGL